MDNDFIDIISSLSMIMLGVAILTSPVFGLCENGMIRK